MVWSILIVLLVLFLILRLFVSTFGNWRLTLIRLADSYIYGVEKEKLSNKDSFLKTLQLRYRLPKTGELLEELEKQNLSEAEMEKRAKRLMNSNLLRQDDEYRYEYILKRKGFVREATELAMSRSLLEGGLGAGERVEREMDDKYTFSNRGFFKKDDFSLLELLSCGLIIEYSQTTINGKSYSDVEQMIREAFEGKTFYQKHLL